MTVNNKHKSNHDKEGHHIPTRGGLIYGDGCTIDGIHYKCLENCPFEDDCHYDTSNGKIMKKASKR